MALQVDYNTNYGFKQTAAYVQINSFSGDKNVVRFDALVYANAAAAADLKVQPLDTLSYLIPYIDGMGITVLYNYLKTLPEFAGAVDV